MKKLFIFLATISTIFIHSNANSATYDSTGTWNYSTYNPWNNCGDPNSNESSLVKVTQNGDSVTAYIINTGITYKGTVSGANYNMSASYNEDGGITTGTVNFTLTSNISAAGTVNWTWTGYGESCSGGSEIKLQKEGVAVSSDFSADPRSGVAPMTVTFSDKSTGDITSWSWNFGDGSSSTKQNPIYTYLKSGTYPVSLTVTGSAGSDTETKTGYITVSSIAYSEKAADYFPLDSGNEWSYTGTYGQETRSVNYGTVNVNGVDTKVWSSSTASNSYSYLTNSYLTNDEYGIRSHRWTDRFTIDEWSETWSETYSNPIKYVSANFTVGSSTSGSGIATVQESINGTFTTSTIPYSYSCYVAGISNITVEAGTFEVVEVKSTIDYDGYIESTTYFFSKGIGLVKSIENDDGYISYMSLTSTNLDSDKDQIGRDFDNCPAISNPDQSDANNNGIGDACDTSSDTDGDGFSDAEEYRCGSDPLDATSKCSRGMPWLMLLLEED